MFSSLVQTVPQIHDGKLRALGTGGPMRSPVLPDVPTISEAGVPGYEAAFSRMCSATLFLNFS
jgi:tripartite-type tricarboxylate transporter receptor subunit TctC